MILYGPQWTLSRTEPKPPFNTELFTQFFIIIGMYTPTVPSTVQYTSGSGDPLAVHFSASCESLVTVTYSSLLLPSNWGFSGAEINN